MTTRPLSPRELRLRKYSDPDTELARLKTDWREKIHGDRLTSFAAFCAYARYLKDAFGEDKLFFAAEMENALLYVMDDPVEDFQKIRLSQIILDNMASQGAVVAYIESGRDLHALYTAVALSITELSTIDDSNLSVVDDIVHVAIHTLHGADVYDLYAEDILEGGPVYARLFDPVWSALYGDSIKTVADARKYIWSMKPGLLGVSTKNDVPQMTVDLSTLRDL